MPVRLTARTVSQSSSVTLMVGVCWSTMPALLTSDVDAAEALDRLVADVAAVVDDRDVGGERERGAAGLLDARRDLGELVGAARDEHDGRALTREQLGRGLTDAGVGAGHDRDLARKPVHAMCLLVGSAARQMRVAPPSTDSACPVMNAASSDAR